MPKKNTNPQPQKPHDHTLLIFLGFIIIIILTIIIVIFLRVTLNYAPEYTDFPANMNTASIKEDSYELFEELGETASPEAAKEIIEKRAAEVTTALKNKDMNAFASLVHPEKGVRFSPYASVDTKKDVTLNSNDIKTLLTNRKIYTWGAYDGSGKPIELTGTKYFESFVYDKDFASADQIGYNTTIGTGNSVNNAKDTYPDSIIVEYYLKGKTEEYGGLDWESLRIVFEKKDDVWYVVGVIHDQWTI